MKVVRGEDGGEEESGEDNDEAEGEESGEVEVGERSGPNRSWIGRLCFGWPIAGISPDDSSFFCWFFSFFAAGLCCGGFVKAAFFVCGTVRGADLFLLPNSSAGFVLSIVCRVGDQFVTFPRHNGASGILSCHDETFQLQAQGTEGR